MSRDRRTEVGHLSVTRSLAVAPTGVASDFCLHPNGRQQATGYLRRSLFRRPCKLLEAADAFLRLSSTADESLFVDTAIF
jgi:hypothetical protein